MSKDLFLVDWENKSQNFLKGYEQSDGTSPSEDLKVILFVRKSNEDLRENELPSYVEVRRAPTDTKDAADTILKQYVATDILDDRPRSSGFWSSSSSNRRIFLVHGGDKGYATLVAQLQECFRDKFSCINGEKTRLADALLGPLCDCGKRFPSQEAFHHHSGVRKCKRCPVLLKTKKECQRHCKAKHSEEWETSHTTLQLFHKRQVRSRVTMPDGSVRISCWCWSGCREAFDSDEAYHRHLKETKCQLATQGISERKCKLCETLLTSKKQCRQHCLVKHPKEWKRHHATLQVFAKIPTTKQTKTPPDLLFV